MPRRTLSKSKKQLRRKRHNPYSRPAAAEAASDDDGTQEPSSETRGQMLRRHSREKKLLRDRIRTIEEEKRKIGSYTPELKKLKKAKRKEILALQAELEARHKAEVASLDTAAKKQEEKDLAQIVSPPMSRLQQLELQRMFSRLSPG
eukprot:RCo031056